MAATETGAAEPAAARSQPDQALLPVKHRGLLLVGVIMVSMCQFLDSTIANVALPHMQAALSASTESVSWVLTTYIIAAAVATPVTGWLSDRIGSRRLFILSAIVFLVTSAMCGAATSLEEMVVFRAIQGMAAGFIGPMTMTIMFDISPPSKQPMTISFYTMIVVLAPISGPTIGGYLVENLSWRWIFYVNLVPGLPALAVLWILLPSRDIERRRLDIFGFAMLALALSALQLMFDRGQHNDWFDSWETVLELLFAVSAFWIFVVHSIFAPSPLFQRDLWQSFNFVMSLALTAVMGVAVIGVSAILPTMYQTIYGYPVLDTGMMMAPRGIGFMITSMLTGQLTKRMDPRYLIATGFAIAAFGVWTMTGWTIVMGAQPILMASFVQGLGFGLIMAPVSIIAFSTLAPDLRPEVSSLLSLARGLGGSVGISIIVAMLSRNQQVSRSDLVVHVAADRPVLADLLSDSGLGALTSLNAEISRQSLMIAFLDDFYMLTWVLIAFVPLPLLLKKPRYGGSHMGPPAVE